MLKGIHNEYLYKYLSNGNKYATAFKGNAAGMGKVSRKMTQDESQPELRWAQWSSYDRVVNEP